MALKIEMHLDEIGTVNLMSATETKNSVTTTVTRKFHNAKPEEALRCFLTNVSEKIYGN